MQSARVKRTATETVVTQSAPIVVGQVDPGIQALTPAAIQNIENAQQIYDQGVEAGASFDSIMATLRQVNPKFTKRPLAPKNVPYFRVIQEDFAAPGAAEKIMELYGEDRGDGNGRQLYSFPILLPSDDLDFFFQESFKAWKSKELFRWSSETPDGLKCTRKQDITQDKSKRRRWGQRPDEFIRDCDPNDCDIFENGECEHYGTLYFWIYRIPGIGLIKMEFKSKNASHGISEIVELALSGLGSIKGTRNGKPIFTISKTLENVSHVDWGKGSVARRRQYIIRMDASGIDMGEIMAQQELGAPEKRLELTGPGEFPYDDNTGPIESGAEEPDIAYPGSFNRLAHEPEPNMDKEVNPDAEIEVSVTPMPVEDKTQALRSTLWGIIQGFNPPWQAEDLQEWLAGNEYTKESVHDPEKLQEIIGKLQAVEPEPEQPSEEDPF